MYNRYIPNGSTYTRIVEQDEPHPPHQHQRQQRQENQRHRTQGQERPPHREPHDTSYGAPTAGHHHHRPEPDHGGLGGIMESITGLFDRLNLDSGDILLLLIMLFLFLEGDNTELVIALALMFVFGLLDKEGD